MPTLPLPAHHIKPGHCNGCGNVKVYGPGSDVSRYRRVTFNLARNTKTTLAFCDVCAEASWTPEREAICRDMVLDSWYRDLDGQQYLRDGTQWTLTQVAPPMPEPNRTIMRAFHEALVETFTRDEAADTQTWAQVSGQPAEVPA